VSIVQVPKQLVRAQDINRKAKWLAAITILTVVILALVAISASSTERKDNALLNSYLSHRSVSPSQDDIAFAQEAAVEYLDAQPATVPLANGVPSNLGRDYTSPTGGSTTRGAPFQYTGLVFYTTKTFPTTPGIPDHIIDEFLVDINNTAYLLDVPLVNPGHRPSIGNILSLMPFSAPASGTQLNWDQYAQTAPNAAETQQINAWATAYLSDNQVQLYELTGDAASNQVFVGLSGWSQAGPVQVVSASTQNGEMLVQIALPMALANKPTDIVVSTYDLLLDNLSHPIPNVVAWGASGAGWSLTPYQNAVAGSLPTNNGS